MELLEYIHYKLKDKNDHQAIWSWFLFHLIMTLMPELKCLDSPEDQSLLCPYCFPSLLTHWMNSNANHLVYL